MISLVICHQRCYKIIDYIPHTVHFILMTHLFFNWKFVPLNSPYLFPPSTPAPLATICFFSVSMTLFLCCYVCSLVMFFSFHMK